MNTPPTDSNGNSWDALHSQGDFVPKYPNGHVIRWLFRNFSRSSSSDFRLLDLGCGGGRHAGLFASHGYQTSAADFSAAGIDLATNRAKEEGLQINFEVTEADNLPYPDASFDGVLSYAVLYYLPFDRFKRAVQEIRRVLKPGGRTFVVTRTTEDSRCVTGVPDGQSSYRVCSITGGAPNDSEIDMSMTFLNKADIIALFQEFHDLTIDRSTYTTGETFSDDDWMIQATR
jgi:SAM-dependent methyltransferase